jgi:pyruvate dehydrogenase E1 component alpha subunit
MKQSGQVAACFFGDGATSEGAFHEGVNLAAIWSLPLVLACENNLYGASTHIERVTRVPRLSERAAGYGIRGETVDGNDVVAVYEAARQAAAECRAGQGPVLLELLTYRRTGHSRRDPCHYQPRSERDAWAARDPIERLGQALVARGDATDADLEAIRAEADRRFEAAVEVGRQAPPPAVEELTTDVYASA